MSLVQRVQNILLKPKETWVHIDTESATVSSIYKEYLIFLAAIPAVAMFIGMSVIGVGAFGFSYRVPMTLGVVSMVLQYALSLVVAYVVALIVDALAPSFGGTKNPLNAFKVVAFALTASYVGGVLNLLPSLSILGILAGLYSVYLLYVGLPVLMKCPEDKAIGYTVVVAVCSIVATAVIAMIVGAVTAAGSFGAGMAMGNMHSEGYGYNAPQGSADAAKVQAFVGAMTALAKQAEKTAPAPAPQALPPVPQQAVAAPEAPAKAVAAYTQDELKALLPDSIGGLKRVSTNGTQVDNDRTLVTGEYGDGKQQVTIMFNDMPAGRIAESMTRMNMTHDEETATSVSKMYHQGPRTISEKYKKDGSDSEYTYILANSLTVYVRSTSIDIATLKSLITALPLDKAEALPRHPAA